ncbi:PK beta-barrel-protein domain-containing protein-like protein [Daldinia loculata]|uniref:PK beta-barrel-protein domain-containing protein-like protein n=1 Tax=Daldinia loculata TaxID=103429 RepID=UPI0020C22A4B|nr:PK beta-barrel-protein domain-containing protein-like protein [Daldinia loculata]KAI1643800.1 PK beta-barrel-protein domain-containing protein-like protein [Daldinia loculata]
MPAKIEPRFASPVHDSNSLTPSSDFTVVAVSRSRPATHDIHSQPTLTAIVRSPSTTPLVLTPEGGIEGHKSAVHDAQVYAFFAHHYDYWTSRLNIERSEWNWAFWGENLTLKAPDGIDEWSINLGDRWVFSSPDDDVNGEHQGVENKGVILEVVGGRSPCSRLAWRCGQPGSWLAEVAKSGFCGVYLKVVRGGSIAPGATAKIIPTDQEYTVPAGSIAQCVFSPLGDPATRTLAERILRVPNLQKMNRQVIARKLGMIEDNEAAGKNRWAGWRSLKVVKVVDESANIKSFYLNAVDDKPLASYLPGQFLTVKLPSGDIRRWSISSWSPSSSTSVPPSYRITVKKGPAASRYLHSNVLTGDTILARSPSGSFVPDLSREFPPRKIYISAGIGMTPILSMLQAHFSHPALKKTPAILIHVARNGEQNTSHFRSELPSFSLFRMITFYTSPITGVDVQGRDFDYTGRPTFEFFTTLLSPSYFIDPLGITAIELPGNVSNAYICGPPDFVDTTRDYLGRCKVPPPAIRYETFSSNSDFKLDDLSVSAADGTDLPEESIVRFRTKEAKWKKAEALSLLELLERDGGGEQPESACREGDCGTCEVRILKGEARVSKNAGKEAKEASGKAGTMIRSCCSFPASKLLELEF